MFLIICCLLMNHYYFFNWNKIQLNRLDIELLHYHIPALCTHFLLTFTYTVPIFTYMKSVQIWEISYLFTFLFVQVLLAFKIYVQLFFAKWKYIFLVCIACKNRQEKLKMWTKDRNVLTTIRWAKFFQEKINRYSLCYLTQHLFWMVYQ